MNYLGTEIDKGHNLPIAPDLPVAPDDARFRRASAVLTRRAAGYPQEHLFTLKDPLVLEVAAEYKVDPGHLAEYVNRIRGGEDVPERDAVLTDAGSGVAAKAGLQLGAVLVAAGIWATARYWS